LIPFIGPDFPHVFPDWGSSTENIVAYFERNSVYWIVQNFIATLALPLNLVFTSGLTAVLRKDGHPTVFAAALTPLMTVIVTLYMVTGMQWTWAAAAAGYHPTLDPSLLRYTFEFSLWIWLLSHGGVALLVLCAGLAIRRSHALPPWTARYSFATAGLSLIHPFLLFANSGILSPTELPSLCIGGAFHLWIAVLGVVLLRLPSPQPHRTPTAQS
ncbi:hypothetical protein AB0I84_41130, partial [Streptomyces spectabilis]|uniref:hypothetical protein n=1 Tax=Streptomyces spectabilis TaxID=68270 RepID=UPI0033DA7A5B